MTSIRRFFYIFGCFLLVSNLLFSVEFKEPDLGSVPSISLSTYGFNAAQRNERPKVALVLSGGGARGFAHIPVIEALEELGIPIDMVVGTSMGALVGGLYAAGYSPADMRRLIAANDMLSLFVVAPIKRPQPIPEPMRAYRDNLFVLEFDDEGLGTIAGLLGDQKILQVLNDALSRVAGIDDFDNLAIPFRSIGADAATGEKVIFSSGSLVEAIRGSISIPLLFSPYPINGRYIVDGGLVDNLPILVAKQSGADIVIAVDVIASDYDVDEKDLNSLTGMVAHILTVVTKNTVVEQLEAADIVITPDLKDYDILDFFNAEKIMESGAQAASEAGESLKNLAKRIEDGRPLRIQDPQRYGSYFLLPDVWIGKVSHRNLTREFESTYEFNIKPFKAFEGLPLDTMRKQQLHELFDEYREYGEFATITYGFSQTRTVRNALVIGDLQIQSRTFPPKAASLGFGAFGASGAQWNTAQKTSWSLFAPSASASFSWNDVGNHVDVWANMRYDDALHVNIGVDIPSQSELGAKISVGYGTGALHPANIRSTPLDDVVVDHMVSMNIAGVYRFSKRGSILAKFESDFMWFGYSDTVVNVPPDLSFSVLPLAKLEAVWTSARFGFFPLEGLRAESMMWLSVSDPTSMYRLEARLRQTIPMKQAFSLFYDIRAGVSRTDYPMSEHYFTYGGSEGMAGYGPGVLVDELLCARAGMIWRPWGRSSAFSVKLAASAGSSSLPVRDRLQISRDLADNSTMFTKLRPFEAGLSLSAGMTTTLGDLLVGVGFSTSRTIALFVEFI